MDTKAINISLTFIDYLDYFYYVNNGERREVTESLSTFTVTKGILPGTQYTIKLYSSFNGWPCEEPKILCNFTGTLIQIL